MRGLVLTSKANASVITLYHLWEHFSPMECRIYTSIFQNVEMHEGEGTILSFL